MQDTENLDAQGVIKYLGMKKTAFYTKVRKKLPPGFHMSPKDPRWLVSTLEDFIRRQAAEVKAQREQAPEQQALL